MSQYDPQPEFTSQTETEIPPSRVFAVLAYLLPLVGGLLGILLDGRNPLTRVHAQQSIATVLAFIISFFVWGAIGYVVAQVPIFGPIVSISLFSLVIAMAVFLAVNWLISLARALRGKERTIPFANRIVLRLFDRASAQKQPS